MIKEKGKTITKRGRLLLGVGLVLCAALLTWAFFPRSFSQTVGVSRGQIIEIEALLDPVDNSEPGYYRVNLTPEDAGFNTLLDLLNSRWYLPMFPGARTRSLLLEESVWISLSYTKNGESFRASDIYLTGDMPIHIGGRDYSVSGSEVFQQTLLDLLRGQRTEYVS